MHSDWYEKTISLISSYKETLDEKDYRKYELDLLKRLVGRVDGNNST